MRSGPTKVGRQHGLTIGRVLILACGIGLAVLVGLVNASFYEDKIDAATAASIMPWGAQANADAAEDAYDAGHYGEAERLAKHSLDRSLTNVQALRVLALSREALNADDSRVAPIMLLASRLGWRDTPTNLWLINAYLQRHQYSLAVQRSDAMLREEEEAGRIFAVLQTIALDPIARKSLIATLIAQPKWRPGLFSPDSLTPGEASGIEAIVGDLHRSIAPPTREEMATLLNGLIRSGDYERAYRLWRLTTPRSDTSVFDMRFKRSALVAANADPAIAFEWVVSGGDSSLYIDYPSDGRGGLLVTPPDLLARNVLTQTVHVSTGKHRFRVMTLNAGKGDEGTLAWSLSCIPARTNVLGQPTYAISQSGKISTDYSFTIPDTGCAFQKLSLSLVPLMGDHNPKFTIDGTGIF
jgi:hypothetical protein